MTLGGPEMQVSAWFFLFPEHPQFLIRVRIKAHLCIHDLIKSEPALSPGEHPRIDMASYLVALEAVTNCGEMWLCVHLPLFPYPSTTVFTPLLMEQVYTSSSWVLGSIHDLRPLPT